MCNVIAADQKAEKDNFRKCAVLGTCGLGLQRTDGTVAVFSVSYLRATTWHRDFPNC